MNTPGRAVVMAQGRFVRLVKRGRWEYAERVNAASAVVIVAVTETGRLLFVEQYRVPCEARVLELPAGIVGDEPGKSGETLESAATRELLEETGYEAGVIEILSSGPPSAGLASEQVALVRARNLRRTGPGGGHAGEDIQVWEIPLTTADEWLRQRAAQGVLIDPKVFAGLYFASR